ncbi:stability determinant [Rhodoferax sp.]|uniref:type II toxin-antitoxin system RelB family antitoxin n=1 Tax=Rhodoferax sp. TaxID=50421 RepID=UPI0025E97310|nr:stability determinant [Rhodoferax sp.]
MKAVLSPIVSEFATQEEAISHDQWFRAKVKEALDDPRPSVPHDEAMARVERLLAEKRQARAVG